MMLVNHNGNCKLDSSFPSRGVTSHHLLGEPHWTLCALNGAVGIRLPEEAFRKEIGESYPGEPFPITGRASPGERDLGQDPVYTATGLAVSSRVLR